MTPGWAADWLLRNTNLQQQRVAYRGANPGVDQWLHELTYAAMAWRASASASDAGSSVALTAEVERVSKGDELGCVGVTQAADLIGIVDRSVRLAISENRLRAEKVGGRWLIDIEDARAFRDRRRAS